MRIDISSRELRDALAPMIQATSALQNRWESADKLVQLVALRAFVDTAKELADELAHPEYDHARAVRLAREMFDAGIALLAIVEDEVRNLPSDDLRSARGAALTFMETIARYLSPFAAIRAA